MEVGTLQERTLMEMKYKKKMKNKGGYSKAMRYDKTMRTADRPSKVDDEYRFNAHMDNDGDSAKDFADQLTRDLDKAEYPVY